MKRIAPWLALALTTGSLTGCFGDSDTSSGSNPPPPPPPPPVVSASDAFVADVVAEVGTASARPPDDISTVVAAGTETGSPIDISTVTIGI